MEPIKIEVTVSVNVDLSQGTKDFLLNILERKIEAESQRTEKTAESLMAALAATAHMPVQSPCGTLGPIGPNGKPISTEAQIESDALNEAAKAAAEEAAKTAANTAPKKDEKPAPTVSIEDVRKVLAEKVNDHRETIKGKLEQLGAPSVTKLEPSKYQEMYDFLKSL